MNNAVLAVMAKSMTYREESTAFNVPKSTLQTKVNTYIIYYISQTPIICKYIVFLLS